QVSPQSRLVICRVADSDGNATAWSVIKGLAFAVTANAELANVSLGAPARIPALSDVLDWCAEKRLTIVASAGNLGIETELYPANYSGVIGIAGLNVNKTKADFSCYDRKVIASAPAVGVASIDWDGGIATWSGTSFSSPIATGMIAEGLRRTGGRISPVRIEKGFSTYGDDLDKINPQYNRMLGSGLNFTKFVSAFKITGI
ncbi:MAG TPA: S8 family serine peptidase, partial [Fimbriimonas sp.]|nr:S8 family serine peptidase [Fimbriimonas sp.]